jgi:membrane protease YdiL (CAAX protease family)
MTEITKEKLKSSVMTTPLLVIFVITAMQLSKFSLTSLDPETNIFVAVGVIQLVTLAMPCVIYYLLKGSKLTEPILIVPKSGPHILFIIFAAMFFVSGMLLIKFFYFVGNGGVAAIVNYYDDFSGTAQGATHLEIILSLIIIPAFCEEFFFRGIVFNEYRKYGTANAVIVSALCFSMLHFSIENFFIYLFAGLLFGFVTAMTKSIIPSILLHLLSNTLSIYASDTFLRVTVDKNGSYFIGFVLTVLAGGTFLLLMSRVESICLSYSQKPPVESIPPKSSEHWVKVFFSPAFILLVIFFICFTLF